MATIYQKIASDKTCILNARQAMLRQFDFGAWTEMRMGFFFSGVTLAGDNTQAVAETVAVSSPLDRVLVGIKNADTADMPGFAGSMFLGTGSLNAGTSESNTQDYQDSTGPLYALGFNGVTVVGGAAGQSMSYSCLWGANTAAATAYCGFYGVQFIITNLGAATQAVAIRNANTSAIAGADYSESALRTYLNNGPWSGTQRTLTWNDGANAYAIPDGFFTYMPFFNNRIRLSCIMAVKYA